MVNGSEMGDTSDLLAGAEIYANRDSRMKCLVSSESCGICGND